MRMTKANSTGSLRNNYRRTNKVSNNEEAIMEKESNDDVPENPTMPIITPRLFSASKEYSWTEGFRIVFAQKTGGGPFLLG
jgi:hypothetical protein